MPTGSSDQVAADSSATVTPAEGVEAAEEAESVEVSPPRPAEPVAETSQSWADLSEVQAPVPSGFDSIATDSADPHRSLVEDKEEIHEAESISAAISAIGLPEPGEPFVHQKCSHAWNGLKTCMSIAMEHFHGHMPIFTAIAV